MALTRRNSIKAKRCNIFLCKFVFWLLPVVLKYVSHFKERQYFYFLTSFFFIACHTGGYKHMPSDNNSFDWQPVPKLISTDVPSSSYFTGYDAKLTNLPTSSPTSKCLWNKLLLEIRSSSRKRATFLPGVLNISKNYFVLNVFQVVAHKTVRDWSGDNCMTW